MIVMETLTVFGELLNPWIYAILFKTATTSTWKDTFMILSQPKGSTEKTPHLGSQGNHPRSAENDAARSKLKKSPTEHQQPTYRELCAKAKTLIRERHEIYFSSLDSDLARQPKPLCSFFNFKYKTRTFPKTLSSGDDNQQGPQASTPQPIAELFNSYFV